MTTHAKRDSLDVGVTKTGWNDSIPFTRSNSSNPLITSYLPIYADFKYAKFGTKGEFFGKVLGCLIASRRSYILINQSEYWYKTL